ncbi:MAG: response regulator [Actinobacteria bacterium]|nr:MAG: response regulator [Actinomycetota bacterium]
MVLRRGEGPWGEMGGTLARILIVDDHSPARSLIRAIVTLDGHQVSEAATGEEALAAIAGEDFDLVILDLVMPGCDGYQVLEGMRAMPGHEGTPVIAVSNTDEEIDAIRSSELGALDHLSKPFGYDEMEKSIKRVLDATPEQIIEIRLNRLAQVETYKKVISLVDEANEPVRRGFFRRVRSAPR